MFGIRLCKTYDKKLQRRSSSTSSSFRPRGRQNLLQLLLTLYDASNVTIYHCTKSWNLCTHLVTQLSSVVIRYLNKYFPSWPFLCFSIKPYDVSPIHAQLICICLSYLLLHFFNIKADKHSLSVGFTIIPTAKPVSYTHLDVYKRQIL